MRTRTISAEVQKLIQELANYSYNGERIPQYMHEPLAFYIAEHVPTGDFLHALLCGDLFEAVHRADDKNVRVLPVYAGFLWNFAPQDCLGSKEKVKAWIKVWLDKQEGGQE